MKKIYTTIVIALISIYTFGQAPHCQWVKSEGGTGSDIGQATTIDILGNVYVAGYYYSPTIMFGTTTLTNVGNGDVCLVKYDANGNILWASGAGGSGYDIVHSVTTDALGNVYVAGSFDSPSITFGSTTLINAASGSYDVFLVKYDSFGNVLWANSAGGANDDQARSVICDALGNVILTGYYAFYSITFGSTTLTNAGNNDMFLVKYNSIGNVIWAKSAGSTGADDAESISTDASGNLYIAGGYYSPSISFGTTTLINNGSTDFFLVKYDSTGNVIWAKGGGGASGDAIFSNVYDAFGNIYVTGYFGSDSIIFGSTTLFNPNGGINQDMLLAKYDTAGNESWAVGAEGFNNSEAFSVASDSHGSVYVTGTFTSDSVIFGNTTLFNAGVNTQNIFMTKYDDTGNVVWALGSGGANYDYGNSVDADAYGNVYTTGTYGSTSITFDTTTLINSGSVSTYDLYLAKFSNDCISHYSVTYDSTTNNFTVIIDSITTVFATGYHWYFGDSTSSTIPTPSHTYALDALYNLCLTIYTASGDSCEYCHIIGIDSLGNPQRAGFTINVINYNMVSIPEPTNNNSSIEIYPNPFTLETTIKFSEEQKNSKIKIKDIVGKEIRTINFTGRQLTISKGEMTKGIYFVQTTDQNKNVTNKKIIIQ